MKQRHDFCSLSLLSRARASDVKVKQTTPRTDNGKLSLARERFAQRTVPRAPPTDPIYKINGEQCDEIDVRHLLQTRLNS